MVSDTLARIESTADRIESTAVALIAKLAPWLAPLPSAYVVWEKAVTHLHWPWLVGLLAAVPVEALGLVTAKVAVDLYSYNRRKGKSEPAAPLWLALVLVFAYFVVAELLTLGLHIAPIVAADETVTLADWALAVFPVLSLVAVTTIAVRVDQAERVAENAEAARQRRAARRATQASADDAQVEAQTAQGSRTPDASGASAERIAAGDARFACVHPGCDFVGRNQQALAAHSRAHGNGHERSERVVSAQETQ